MSIAESDNNSIAAQNGRRFALNSLVVSVRFLDMRNDLDIAKWLCHLAFVLIFLIGALLSLLDPIDLLYN